MNPRTLVALALLAPALALAQDAAKPAAKAKAKGGAKDAIATVNGVAVPKARMDYMMFQQRNRGAPDNDQTRAMVREELVNREVLQQEAEKAGFGKKAEVQTQVAMARQEILVGAYLRDWVQKHPVSDAEVQKEYDKARAQAGEKEYKARHILVDSEDQANKIIAELKKGAKFDELAEFPWENIHKMRELGLFGIIFPPEYGGAGLDTLSYVLAVEEISRACASTGITLAAHVSLGTWPIYKFGTAEQKQKYLPPLCTGEKLAAFGLTEPEAGSDAGGTKTRAVPGVVRPDESVA